ncbi:zinc finger protein OZF-like [Trichogramma pretiosum]|uniref:zinc finger protein OZF-like n=1 Tax=Trichogramma pretiosum TaxID=7493 RepID=UPI0006C9B3D8|nr:zinc finger protein OZF-like [Trichogramma pretiosum]
MENGEDTVRMKQEPNDVWLDAGHDYIFDPLDSNCETNHTNETAALHNKFDAKIKIDFECTKVKPEVTFLSKVICKSEYENNQPIIKSENEDRTHDGNKSIIIDFESQDIKPELMSLFDEKSPMILTITEMDYDNDSAFQKRTQLNLVESEEVKAFEMSNLCRKTYKEEANLDARVNKKYKSIEPIKCEICHKSFKYQCYLKYHVNAVHNRSRPFECDIRKKSFSQKGNLDVHKNVVHDDSKHFECEICHKSFGYKSNLNKHINAIHSGIKPFECETCHKSFSYKSSFDYHIRIVHDRSKAFECDICHKSFGLIRDLKIHIKTVHNRIKSFCCEICHKLFGYKQGLKYHINTAHIREFQTRDLSRIIFSKK